jgi:hypothetical protein
MSVCVEAPFEPYGLRPKRLCAEFTLNERGSFIASVRQLLKAPSDELGTYIGRCGQVSLVGSRHREVVQGAAAVVNSVACKVLNRPSITDVDLFLFVTSCVCQSGLVSSLFCTDKFSPYEPVCGQDKQVWLLCRSIFEMHESRAECVFDALSTRLPQCMAACGFMALCMRTPFAFALFLHQYEKRGEVTVASATLGCVDPVRRRPVVSVVSRSVVGTNEVFDDRVCLCIESGIEHIGAHRTDQAGVLTPDDDITSLFVEELSYSNTTDHCLQWERLAKKARQHCEGSNDSVCAEAWSSVWESVSLTAEMSYRVLQRRKTTPFVVLWLHTDKRFVCFARQLTIPREYEDWCTACARDVEASVRRSFEQHGCCLCPPVSRSAKRYAFDIRDREDRWSLECCDSTSRAAMEAINAARERPDQTCFMMAQGSFRMVLSVCFLSFVCH